MEDTLKKMIEMNVKEKTLLKKLDYLVRCALRSFISIAFFTTGLSSFAIFLCWTFLTFGTDRR